MPKPCPTDFTDISKKILIRDHKRCHCRTGMIVYVIPTQTLMSKCILGYVGFITSKPRL